jgi:cytochrome b6-f complex iron-sulfur subunit
MTWTRRRFLATTAAGGAAVTLGTGAPGCGNPVALPPLVQAMVIDERGPLYGTVTVDAAQLPPVGGAVTLQLQQLAPSTTRTFVPPPDGRILLIQYAQDMFSAVESTCPHAGCPLGYSGNDKAGSNMYGQVECPCHSSRFRAVADVNDGTQCAGLVLHGPAQASLTAWAITFSGKSVTIDLTSRLACNNAFPPVVNGAVTLPIAQFPQLAVAGGSAIGQPEGFSDTLIVVRVDASTVAVLSAVCTHLGCLVNYVAQNQDLECPCHASAYALDGHVLAPPAPSPLKAYSATLMANAIVIATQ